MPEGLLRDLRKSAQKDRRSLTQQIIHLLDAALHGRVGGSSAPLADVDAQLAAWRALAGRWESDVDRASEALDEASDGWPRSRVVKLLDTDTCISILRGNEAVIESRARTPEDVVTTWINAAELYYGAATSVAPEKNRALVQSFLATLPVLGLDEASVQVFGEAKALLERLGQRLDDADLLIGAMAVAQRATVVTGNRRHYERIPGVMVEDWIR